MTWLCLDSSSLNRSWIQYIPELLGESKTLTLSNGEHLRMKTACFKLIFETGTLEHASPAAILNSVRSALNLLLLPQPQNPLSSLQIQGIVYFDSAVLGWRPVVKRWLTDRDEHESKCLRKYFEQIMDSILEFVLHKTGYESLKSNSYY